MYRKNTSATTRADASGSVVAVCHGHRCAGLRRLAGNSGQVQTIRDTVQTTAGAVLVTFPCMERCEMASLVAVARRDGPGGRISLTVWLSGLEDEDRAAALSEWIASGGPQWLDQPEYGLPRSLAEAVTGVGSPPRLSRGVH